MSKRHKPYSEQTPRERLLEAAIGIRRVSNCDGNTALNAVIDGWRSHPSKAPIVGMANYFLNCSDVAHGRLIAAVEKK